MRKVVVRVAGTGVFLVPILHPLLIPITGGASHLLWFLHAILVGGSAYLFGPRGLGVSLLASVGLVALGESLFGAGYWVSADSATLVSLVVAVGLVDLLAGLTALVARRQTAAYQHLFEAAPVGLLQVDGEGWIRRSNAAAAQLFQLGDGCQGHRIAEVIRSPEISLAEESWCWEGPMEIGIAGEARPFHGEVTVERRRGNGDLLQVMVQDRSIEMNQRIELERQSRLASLGEGLAGVAHELNNPLSIVMAHAHLAQAADLEGAREALTVIGEASERMRDLIQELLGYSRDRNSSGVTSLLQVVRRLVRVKQIGLPRGIRLQLEAGGDVVVPAEESRVEQVLLNLVSNAVHAVQTKGGGTVLLRVVRESSCTRVEVLDDGPGIDPEVHDRIFSPFVTTKPEGEGTGLGLTICRRLSRGWGGDLTAANRPEGGARFVLTFPRPERPPVD